MVPVGLMAPGREREKYHEFQSEFHRAWLILATQNALEVFGALLDDRDGHLREESKVYSSPRDVGA